MPAKKRTQTAIRIPVDSEPMPTQRENSGGNQLAPDELQLTAHDPNADNPLLHPKTTHLGAHKNLELSQKVARLLSQEPHAIPFQPLTNHPFPASPVPPAYPADLSAQISSLVDQKVQILDEKLKLYQAQITQLRNELEAKNQVVNEFQKFQQSEAEKMVEKFKAIAEAKFAANAVLIKAQATELRENRATIKQLNEKISRVYSGEEEQNRIKLEAENQELVKANEHLKFGLDGQRRKRKEAERELARASLAAQGAVQDRLNEANDEIETLKKMLEAETTNSKGLINQLNQLRSSNHNSVGSSNPQRHNHSNNPSSNSSNHANDKSIEDMKTRASIIGDFTGFAILNSSADKKGSIYDCIVTDIVSRGFALNFKLQLHSDNTCSYFPSLDPERDSSTIKILPEFLRAFVRFQKEASGHVYWKLFQAFNLK